MQVDVIYRDQVIGGGNFPHIIPRQGDYFEINGNTFIVDAVKFVYKPYTSNGNVSVKLFISDISNESKRRFRTC